MHGVTSLQIIQYPNQLTDEVYETVTRYRFGGSYEIRADNGLKSQEVGSIVEALPKIKKFDEIWMGESREKLKLVNILGGRFWIRVAGEGFYHDAGPVKEVLCAVHQ